MEGGGEIREEVSPNFSPTSGSRPPIWHCLLRYAPSASSTYRRGYACGVFGRKPSIQNHFGSFASKIGEKSGSGMKIETELQGGGRFRLYVYVYVQPEGREGLLLGDFDESAESIDGYIRTAGANCETHGS